LISSADIPLQGGAKLTATSAKGRDAGWITSAGHSERIGKEIALGYVKRGFNIPGTKLDALAWEDSGTAAAIPIEVVPLPFV
jgi:glycine cleavage system aminomethyltransferase T